MGRRGRALVLPDDVTAHPLQVSIDIASLAPNAEITVFPWKDPPELKARTINRGAHLPEAAPAGVSPDVLFRRRWPAERVAHAGRAFHRSSSQVTLSRRHPAHAV
jgi:hypothetical protein